MNVGILRLALVIIGVLGVLATLGIIVLALRQAPIPDALVLMAGNSTAGLLGILIPTRTT